VRAEVAITEAMAEVAAAEAAARALEAEVAGAQAAVTSAHELRALLGGHVAVEALLAELAPSPHAAVGTAVAEEERRPPNFWAAAAHVLGAPMRLFERPLFGSVR